MMEKVFDNFSRRMKDFEKIILRYHKTHHRNNLPWRDKNVTPYHVWVSEVMLQQTQVRRVVPYYQKFIKKFSTVRALSIVSWKEFLPYYQGLGYYRRGRNMLETAKIVSDKYSGKFPADKKELMSLPGIGMYTASAILSFGYGQNELAFDTNMQKVLGRYLFGNRKAKLNGQEISDTLSGNKKLLNAAIMDFANDVCTNTPQCLKCPLSKTCVYASKKEKSETTSGNKRNVFPTKQAQVFLWLHKDHREYYSKNPDVFEVFQLPTEENTRAAIKAYFKKKYHLELSVRSPHRKIFFQGIPTLFVNAQILLGKHEFGIFQKDEMRRELENILRASM